jgi:hypothetical protein
MAAGSWSGRRVQPERSRRCGKEHSSYRPPPALRPSWPGGGSCRPGKYSSVTVRARGRRGASPAQPAPRQTPPAVTITAAVLSGGAALHRPLGLPQPVQLRRQRPGAVLQILQIAVAVERPAMDAAGPTAPVTGLGGARTGVVGLGPARAAAGLVDPRAGRDSDLPGAARLAAPHEASPPLAYRQAPANPPSRRARPGRSASLTHRTPRR